MGGGGAFPTSYLFVPVVYPLTSVSSGRITVSSNIWSSIAIGGTNGFTRLSFNSCFCALQYFESFFVV